MKTNIICAALGIVAMLASCSKPDTGYTISGTTDAKDGAVAMLYVNRECIASDTIKNGLFQITGQADSVAMGRIQIAERRQAAIVIIEPGNIKVNFDEGSATGTALNDDYTATGLILSEAYAKGEAYGDSIYKDQILKMYDKHADNVLGVQAFLSACSFWTLDEIKEALKTASPLIQQNPQVKAQIEMLEIQSKTAPGATYLDIVGIDALSSDSLKLSTFVSNGKPTLVDFWASWCRPCRAEIPNLAACAKKYAGKINVVGIAVWDKLPETQKAMEELQITWPVIFAERASDAYGIQGIPHIMLIDADGTIVERGLRGEQIAPAIEQVLAGQ